MAKLVKEHTARPVQFKGFHSQVDIIIPFHGNYDGVAKLIESIFRYTHSGPYRVCLVDDASPNTDFLDDLTKVPNLKCLRTNNQKGFGGAMQVGYEQTDSPYCVFLQSDVLVEDVGWLRAMGDSLIALKDKGVKMVAPRTNNCMNGDERQQAEKGTTTEDIILTDSNLSLYAFMCHRELFPRIGGFIKNYPFGWFEDEELSHRMRKFSYKQAICGKSWVHHEGGVTIKELWRKRQETQKIMKEDNYDKCLADIKALQKR